MTCPICGKGLLIHVADAKYAPVTVSQGGATRVLVEPGKVLVACSDSSCPNAHGTPIEAALQGVSSILACTFGLLPAARRKRSRFAGLEIGCGS